MGHRDVITDDKFARALRMLGLLLIGASLSVLVAACGGGSADEPSSPRAVSTGTSSAVTTTTGVSVIAGPRPVGAVSVTSSDKPDSGFPGFRSNECSLDYLNSTRFLASGVQAVAIDDSIACGFCPSAEICTTPDGVCHCVVVR